MKSLSLIFYANNGDAAKVIANRLRAEGKSAQLRQMVAYGDEVEPCDSVIVMPDVVPFDRGRIDAAYGDKVQRAEKPKLSLPPAPVAPVPQAPKGK